MKIGIDINGVLRDTIGKFKTTYEKFLIENNSENSESENPFEYKINEPIDSLDLMNHFSFQSKEEFFSFLYEEFPMEIFGHSQSSEYSTFNDLNEMYLNLRDNHDILIVSDEMGRSKPSSLFFLSKFGCQIEKVKFYSNMTINSMWDEIDVLLTANPALLLEHPDDKIIIQYQTEYNKHIKLDNSITTIKELEFELTKII
jgi:hypothetical protein